MSSLAPHCRNERLPSSIFNTIDLKNDIPFVLCPKLGRTIVDLLIDDANTKIKKRLIEKLLVIAFEKIIVWSFGDFYVECSCY